MINHAVSQNDLPLEMQILNISVNMARIGNWIADLSKIKAEYGEKVYRSRRKLIEKMINQTENYLNDLSSQKISGRFVPTLGRFTKEFKVIKNGYKTDPLLAKKALTWANILQHRAKLA
ncbi:hypothetical protein HYW46_01410 [Candidatus Daviesbacteria bacterium]|nr:hypothetical protein [Candidatus Daviesbacteria bacterium]